jgi:beta-aspartyl-peptidase (threonine type)
LIGCGTYASNRGAAISGTGEGEYFIRLTVAHRISALVEYAGLSLQAACDHVVQGDLERLGGQGGVIAVAPDGEMAWSFNTSGMYRARVSHDQPMVVGIYKDDP